MQEIVTLISTVGFPIAMCVAMAFYVKYINDQNNTKMQEVNQLHYNEMVKMVEAIDNNTMALTKLSERMDKNAIGG